MTSLITLHSVDAPQSADPIVTGARTIGLYLLTIAGTIYQSILITVGHFPTVQADGVDHAGAGYGVPLGPPPASGPVLSLDAPHSHDSSIGIIWPILDCRLAMPVIPGRPPGCDGWADRVSCRLHLAQ